jgi:HK97 gp10 family phage protein
MLNLTDEGRKKLNNAVRKKGFKVVRKAKGNAPVDTGRLRASISLEEEFLGNGLVKVLVGSNVDYARFVEFGTESQVAQPYLRPALREVAQE